MRNERPSYLSPSWSLGLRRRSVCSLGLRSVDQGVGGIAARGRWHWLVTNNCPLRSFSAPRALYLVLARNRGGLTRLQSTRLAHAQSFVTVSGNSWLQENPPNGGPLHSQATPNSLKKPPDDDRVLLTQATAYTHHPLERKP